MLKEDTHHALSQLSIQDSKQWTCCQGSPAEVRSKIQANGNQARAMLLREIPLSEASMRSIAKGFLSRHALGLSLDEPVRAARRYLALKAEAVRSAFAK